MVGGIDYDGFRWFRIKIFYYLMVLDWIDLFEICLLVLEIIVGLIIVEIGVGGCICLGDMWYG